MKLFKRISAIFLAVIMTVTTFGYTTAFAAENTDSQQKFAVISTQSNDFQVVNDYNIILSNSRPSAAGNPFVPTTSRLWLGVGFTPTNGSVILAVRLRVYSTNQIVGEWQSSNGSINEIVSVTPGQTYIFEYLRAYGTQNINVHNFGYSVSG